MFVEQVLRQYVPQEPITALDLCAAPGGKSTLLRSLLPEGSLLVANEVMRQRSQVLAENLTKWGHPDVVVTNNDPADFTSLGKLFDLILTDVPCSGEGMFRKDETAVSEWSPENVELCWQRQRRILTDIWPCLKPGGLLIYSTCTYNTQENEENVRWIRDALGAEILPLDISPEWHIIGNLLPDETFPVYRFLPHKVQSEGFFLAVLRKAGGTEESMADNVVSDIRKVGKNKRKEQVKGKNLSTLGKEQLHEAQSWLTTPDTYDLQVCGNLVSVLPRVYAPLIAYLQSSLHVLQSGCSLAELKGRDLVPHHALAMNRLLKEDAFPRVKVEYGQAIAYLRRETITLDEAPRGFVLLTYRQMPLGFVKNIGNRANNLYPPEWRIRSSYLPEEVRLALVAMP